MKLAKQLAMLRVLGTERFLAHEAMTAYLALVDKTLKGSDRDLAKRLSELKAQEAVIEARLRGLPDELETKAPELAARAARYDILYPETGSRTGAELIQWAKDHVASEYMVEHPNSEDAAVEENSRVSSVLQAMEILSDAGVVTFTQAARDEAEARS